MSGTEYTPLQVKNWRAITYDWNVLTSYTNQSRLYCLTDFQVAWLLSTTEYFRWLTRWSDCPCTQADMDAMKAEMDYNLMSCLDIQPYQIQALFDQQTTELLDGYESLWDGVNPSSVNSNAPDDFFDGNGSSDRENALCTALSLWAYSYSADWISKANVVLGVANVVSNLISFLVPVGGVIAVRALSDLTAPIQAQIDALSNLQALDNVICEWKANLTGVSINASAWNNGVDVLSYPTNSDEDRIQKLFATDTQLLQNFLSFVDALGDGYELAQIGIFICPVCNLCLLPITIDFESGVVGDCGVIDDGSIVSSPARGSYSLAKTTINETSDPTLDVLIDTSGVRDVTATWWHYFSPLSSRDVTIQLRAFDALDQQLGLAQNLIFTVTQTWTQVSLSLTGLSSDVVRVEIKSALNSGVTPLTVAIDDVLVSTP